MAVHVLRSRSLVVYGMTTLGLLNQHLPDNTCNSVFHLQYEAEKMQAKQRRQSELITKITREKQERKKSISIIKIGKQLRTISKHGDCCIRCRRMYRNSKVGRMRERAFFEAALRVRFRAPYRRKQCSASLVSCNGTFSTFTRSIFLN
jgi:hypothetical protein